jgi:hypothetical protein
MKLHESQPGTHHENTELIIWPCNLTFPGYYRGYCPADRGLGYGESLGICVHLAAEGTGITATSHKKSYHSCTNSAVAFLADTSGFLQVSLQ